ncbi:zinc finger, C4 type [Necator americanus]|uniref:Zinc finger, C4 type n=1 Tax=Necator americanus TaxID=51031 RepID=W2TSF0_NECAM|nr:zinc finger, C4 type [Necator americanus]ETN84990.1 zinc finger, C4 type [Necator americanus]
MVDVNNLLSSQNYLNWSMLNKFYGKPQMSTPDDPVIHSPPSLSGQLMNGFNPALTPAKMEEGMAAACASPDASGIDPNSDGTIFFQEFKCPYSEDCEINAVSRRFCQKCRLRKCFAVGMKKEWILNEEQLRRRKNSRLNNMANQQRQKQELARQHAAVKAMTSPLSISPMVDAQLGALSGRGGMPPLVSPAGQYPLMSPAGSGASDSPPSRPLGLMAGSQGSPDAYESNMMMQQRLRSQLPQATMSGNKVVDPSRQVIISMDEYHSLVQRATRPGEDEPLSKRPAYSPSELVAPQPRPFQSPSSQMLPVHNISQIRAGIPTYTDLGAASSGDLPKASFTSSNYEEGLEKMNMFFHNTIEDALKIDSPDDHSASASVGVTSSTSTSSANPPHEAETSGTSLSSSSDKRLSYQLNAAELQALDLIQEAFKGMNDPMEQGRQKTSFLKNEKSPADIMNIMDVTMRRFVKMAKKLPAFNDLSQDGKFALLKGGMIEMLTVRGVRRFDSSSGSWTTPTLKESCEVSINMFDQLNADVRSEQKMRFLQFFKIFHEDIRSNDLVISMIMLIVLFSPRDCITDPEDRRIIARHHEQFCALLNRYLESLYGDDAHKLNEQLPTALRMLREISASCGMLFLGTVNTSEAEPLPREFFKVE